MKSAYQRKRLARNQRRYYRRHKKQEIQRAVAYQRAHREIKNRSNRMWYFLHAPEILSTRKARRAVARAKAAHLQRQAVPVTYEAVR